MTRLALEEAERDTHSAIEENLLDPEDSPGADTVSDDGTIDGNDQGVDLVYGPGRYGRPSVSNSRPRLRPRSLQDLSSNHVEMPLLDPDQMQRIGPWTPSGPLTPEIRAQLAPAHLNLMSSSSIRYDQDRENTSARIPASQPMFDLDYQDAIRSRSQTRRHTMESSAGYFPPPAPSFNLYNSSTTRITGSPRVVLPPNPRTPSDHSSRLSTNRRTDAASQQSFLRPDPDYSAFDANHDSIMSTIPGSRDPSRSNSPQLSRVSSRNRMGALLSNMRALSSSTLTPSNEMAGGSRLSTRSREVSRQRNEAHREAILRAMMAADAAEQLRPDLPPAILDGPIDTPLLPPGLMDQAPMSPLTPADTPRDQSPAAQIHPDANGANQDVNMTQ